MDFNLWLTYLVASGIILAVPGPTIILVVSRAVQYGRPSVWPLVGGVVLGDLTAMSLSLLGLGALMATSATLFSILKWLGAGYLLFLGLKLFRKNAKIEPHEPIQPAISISGKRTAGPARDLFRQSYLVTSLNPKSIAFFTAFLPHFIRTDTAPLPQMIILGSTFLAMAALNSAIYAVCAGQLGEKMRQPKMQCVFNRLGGSALIGAGIFTGTMQRAN